MYHQFLVMFDKQTGYEPTFFATKDEAITHLKISKQLGWVYKVKVIAMSHKVEEWKVESVKNIKVDTPIVFVQEAAPVSEPDFEEEPPFIPIMKCYFCGKKATTIIDNKPLCSDCGGV